jgi:hypothetical protein
MDLGDLIAQLARMPEDQRASVIETAKKANGDRKVIPNPGPQTEAWFSKADVLLYGGEGGGGKTGLLCGLALCEHQNSLLVRRQYSALIGVGGLIDELKRLNGPGGSFNGSPPATLRTDDGRVITLGGAANPGDEQQYQGKARDFLGIDEAAQFLESQVRFLMGWVRSVIPGQRTRVVLASNAPLDNTGDWMVPMFAPWLDPAHPRPAKQGELRWFITRRKPNQPMETEDIEVDGSDPVDMDGETYLPTSRTFIRARLTDNPFLGAEYKRQLDALPEPYRSAVRDGNFMASKVDDPWQVIPTAWIREAQARWTPEPPEASPMTALAADIAQGGNDTTTLAARYDWWLAPLDQHPGHETPTGNEVAGLIIGKRRNGAVIVIDMGGGYGGATMMRLQDNDIRAIGFKGAEASTRRTKDNLLGFWNKRAEIYWRLREALDPAQDGGAVIALPPDPELVSDLTAPRYEVTARGIKITTKEDVVDMLGRSPDKGDAVAMAWSAGPSYVTHGEQWRQYAKSAPGRAPNVVMSRMAARRKR